MRPDKRKTAISLVAVMLKAGFRTVILILLLTYLVFLAMSILPKDSTLPPENGRMQNVRRALIDHQDYRLWLKNLIHGDLGYSHYYFGAPIRKHLFLNLSVTAGLSIFGVCCSSLAGILLGVVSSIFDSPISTKRNRRFLPFLSMTIRYLIYALNVIPSYILGIALLVFSHFLSLPFLAITAICLGSGVIMDIAQLTYRNMLDHFAKSYVLNALAMGLQPTGGLPNPQKVSWYAFRSTIISILPLIGSKVPFVVGNVIVVEVVFEFRGLSDALLTGLIHLDIPLVLAVMVCSVLIVQLIALGNELIEFIINPEKLFVV